MRTLITTKQRLNQNEINKQNWLDDMADSKFEIYFLLDCWFNLFVLMLHLGRKTLTGNRIGGLVLDNLGCDVHCEFWN